MEQLQLLDGVGPVTARRILDRIDPCNQSPEPAWQRWPTADDLLPASAVPGATELVSALEEAATLPSAGAQAERLRLALTPLVREHYADFPPRLRDLEQLAASAATAPSLEQFAADLILDPPSSSSDLAGPPHLDEDYLVLSTLHSAKGLEWEIVHLLHLSDGNIPSDMALTNPKASRKNAGSSTSASPARARTCTCTCRSATTTNPGAEPTPTARNHLTLPHPDSNNTASTPGPPTRQARQPVPELAASINVSVDELWQ